MYVTLLIKHEKISQEKIKVAIKEEYERELKDNRLKIIEDALHSEDNENEESDDEYNLVAYAPNYNDIAASAPDYNTLNLQMLYDDDIFEMTQSPTIDLHNLVLIQPMPVKTSSGLIFMLQ